MPSRASRRASRCGTDDWLVLCNSSYRNILYAGMIDLVVPGTPFETIVRTAIERGIIEDAGDDIDAWISVFTLFDGVIFTLCDGEVIG